MECVQPKKFALDPSETEESFLFSSAFFLKSVLWEAVDEEGNRYQVGGSTEQLVTHDGKRQLEQQLIVSGLDHLPKKLTLKAERVIKRYEGNLWEETIQLK